MNMKKTGKRLCIATFTSLCLIPWNIGSLPLAMAAAEAAIADAGWERGTASALRFPSAKVRLGVERPELYDSLLRGKRVGLLTNQSGVDSQLRSTVDILRENYHLAGICVPEHGLFGAVAAGGKVDDGNYCGILVYSLYDENQRPSRKLLRNFDVMVCDIQDVGARHYTYVSTLAYMMQGCAEAGIPVVVLDRPNPLGGAMQGPVMKEEYKGFIGLYPVPLRHGLTIGEYARLINGKFMPEDGQKSCELHVIPVEGLTRDMLWEDTGLPWVNTSPLIPTAETTQVYVMTGIIGSTNLSNGVGTAKPFFYAAAPYIDPFKLAERLNSKVPGVYFRPVGYTPRYGSKNLKSCWGVEIYVTSPRTYNPAEAGATIIRTVQEMYPEHFKFRMDKKAYHIDADLGEGSLHESTPLPELFARWERECRDFARMVQPYLLY